MSQDKPSSSELAQSVMLQSSMQDIIKSINRIIDEDNRMPPATPIIPRDKPGILELTEVIEADGSVRSLDGSRAFDTQPGDEVIAATVAPRTEPPLSGTEARPDELRDKLVSAAAAEATVAGFGRLEMLASEQRADPGPALGIGGRTLEDIVRDVLRPLLQAWLDQHLPILVERLVQDEIKRLVREARLR